MRTLVLLIALHLLALPLVAQVTEPNQRAENRRALRDARKAKAPYKDSHLAVNKASLKRDGGGRQATPRDGREGYKFDKTGAARVSEPGYRALRLRKKKKE